MVKKIENAQLFSSTMQIQAKRCVQCSCEYLITKKLAGGCRPFDGPVRDVNGRLLIPNDGRLKKCRER